MNPERFDRGRSLDQILAEKRGARRSRWRRVIPYMLPGILGGAIFGIVIGLLARNAFMGILLGTLIAVSFGGAGYVWASKRKAEVEAGDYDPLWYQG